MIVIRHVREYESESGIAIPSACCCRGRGAGVMFSYRTDTAAKTLPGRRTIGAEAPLYAVGLRARGYCTRSRTFCKAKNKSGLHLPAEEA